MIICFFNATLKKKTCMNSNLVTKITTWQQMEITENIRYACDQGQVISGVYLDFKNVSDTVHDSILLARL